MKLNVVNYIFVSYQISVMLLKKNEKLGEWVAKIPRNYEDFFHRIPITNMVFTSMCLPQQFDYHTVNTTSIKNAKKTADIKNGEKSKSSLHSPSTPFAGQDNRK